MKFNFDIECTPEEARAFVGLPNIAPMQERMMKELEGKMQENLRNLTPEEMVKTWMPATMQGIGDMQKMFWSQMGVKTPNNTSEDSKDND
ncbi:MAG: hypothetical protein COB14_03465 [Alphaproteobacteria bacterium]|nr:MAG: hypothetical protein COB14_03465 [Alphaproteobacteria bacterium]